MKDDDFTLAIMLGAMAVECELAFMFFKWTRIDMKMKMSNLGADIKITQGTRTRGKSNTVTGSGSQRNLIMFLNT